MNLNTLARRAAFVTPLLCALAALPLLLVPATSQATTTGSGRMASEMRQPGDFQAVTAAGSIDLVLRQGATTSVQVNADDNLLPLLETVVDGSGDGATLQVRWKRGQSISQRSRVSVSIVMPKLNALTGAGSGDIKVEPFQTPALQVTVAGSGSARFEALNADDLGIRISGSGNVDGKGRASRLKVSIAGSGSVKLTEMNADDVNVSIAGSGDAAVNAQKTLTVGIAGSGDVVYTGDPAVKSSVAGSGRVRKK